MRPSGARALVDVTGCVYPFRGHVDVESSDLEPVTRPVIAVELEGATPRDPGAPVEALLQREAKDLVHMVGIDGSARVLEERRLQISCRAR